MVALPDEIPPGVPLKKVKPCLCTNHKTFLKISLGYVLLEGTLFSYQPANLLIRLRTAVKACRPGTGKVARNCKFNKDQLKKFK